MRKQLFLISLFAAVLLFLTPSFAGDNSVLFEGKKISQLADDEVCAEAILRILASDVANGRFERVERLKRMAYSSPNVRSVTPSRDRYLACKILDVLKKTSKNDLLSRSTETGKKEPDRNLLESVEAINRPPAGPFTTQEKKGNFFENLMEPIDSSIEEALGEILYKSILAKYKESAPEDVSMVKAISSPVFKAAKEDRPSGKYIITVIDWVTEDGKSIPNALCAPGAYIFVTSGLINVVERDKDAIAFALGHEAGHHVNKDSIKKIRMVLVTMPVKIIAEKFVKKYLELPVSRKNEFEADALGLKYMTKAGFNANGAITCLKKLAEYTNEPVTPVPDSSHPGSYQRIEKLKILIEKGNKK